MLDKNISFFFLKQMPLFKSSRYVKYSSCHVFSLFDLKFNNALGCKKMISNIAFL